MKAVEEMLKQAFQGRGMGPGGGRQDCSGLYNGGTGLGPGSSGAFRGYTDKKNALFVRGNGRPTIGNRVGAVVGAGVGYLSHPSRVLMGSKAGSTAGGRIESALRKDAIVNGGSTRRL